MSGIALTTGIPRGTDSSCDVSFIGANYDGSRVTVRVTFQPSGQFKDYVFSPTGGVATIAQLVSNVNNFAGLRVSMLQYLQALDSSLAGTVT